MTDGKRAGSWAVALRAVALAALACMALAAYAILAALPARVQARPTAEPIAVRVLNAPNPVLGADNRMHLVYELQISDLFPIAVKLKSVQALRDGKPIGVPVRGRRLTTELRLDSGATGTTLPKGVGAILFMDVTYRRGQPPPKQLIHRISISFTYPGTSQVKNVSFVGAPTAVGQTPPIIIAPPLRGSRWIDVNGCCATITSHRGATEPIDGTPYVPERFAIDFVQLNAMDRLLQGPVDQLSSYPYFGASVYSVADGTVVATHGGEPEQVPGQGPPPATVTVQNAGGNYIVIKIAPGHYAFYAHLQPGSFRVRKGERVKTGQVIALLGDTGNATAPHLHFHVMSSPSPLKSNGLPFVFSSFDGVGTVNTGPGLFAGRRAQINAATLAGPHRDQLPLNNQEIDLGTS
jgi:Peptidase family M23